MPSNPFDQLCRYLLQVFALPLLSWFLRLPSGQLDFVGWLDTRHLPWPGEPDRTCDTVAYLRDHQRGGVPWAIPIEFQIDPDPDMFGRGLSYLGSLWQQCRPTPLRGDRFEVGLLVVNLRGRGYCSRNMHMTNTTLRTHLEVIEHNLSQVSAQDTLADIAAGNAPSALLPWIPLFRGGDDPAIIAAWKTLAEAQLDPDLRRVMRLTLIFAEAIECIQPWKECLKGWDEVESQIVKEWTQHALEKGLAEGKMQGIAKGLRDGKADTLLLILRRLRTPLPADLEQTIAQITDLDVLDQAVVTALSVNNLDDFRLATGW